MFRRVTHELDEAAELLIGMQPADVEQCDALLPRTRDLLRSQAEQRQPVTEADKSEIEAITRRLSRLWLVLEVGADFHRRCASLLAVRTAGYAGDGLPYSPNEEGARISLRG